MLATPTGGGAFADVRLGGTGGCDNVYNDRTRISHGGYRSGEGVVGIIGIKESFMWTLVIWTSPNDSASYDYRTRMEALAIGRNCIDAYAVELYGPDGEYEGFSD